MLWCHLDSSHVELSGCMARARSLSCLFPTRVSKKHDVHEAAAASQEQMQQVKPSSHCGTAPSSWLWVTHVPNKKWGQDELCCWSGRLLAPWSMAFLLYSVCTTSYLCIIGLSWFVLRKFGFEMWQLPWHIKPQQNKHLTQSHLRHDAWQETCGKMVDFSACWQYTSKAPLQCNVGKAVQNCISLQKVMQGVVLFIFLDLASFEMSHTVYERHRH